MGLRAAAAVSFLVLVQQVCLGWGGQGHQVVTVIAEARLTDDARAQVKELLGDADMADAEVVNWADQIRRDRQDTAPWHYVNIPHDAAGYDAKRDTRPEGTVISALERQTRLLANKRLPREQRTEALKFVIHFVGDLHQPLHCVDRNGDRGGNKQLVFYREQRKAVSLHLVWDTLILRDLMKGTPVLEYAEKLGAGIRAEQATQWAKGTPAAWASEGRALAATVVYAGVAADQSPKLSEEYLQAARPVTDEQMRRAGVRLAVLLEALRNG